MDPGRHDWNGNKRMNQVGDEVVDREHPVITVGKSLGGAIGWGELNRVESNRILSPIRPTALPFSGLCLRGI